jgi:hypothetical protein
MPQGWRPTHPGDPTPKWGVGRKGLLAIAITVVVGVVIALVVMGSRAAGAADGVAGAAASPEPPPLDGRVEMLEQLFAPDDLAFTIPSTVGEYEVDGEAGPLDVDVYGELWRDLLLPLGQDASDVRTASGLGFPAGEEDALDRAGPTFQVSAMRLDGVPAISLVEPFVSLMLDGFPEGMGTSSGQSGATSTDATFLPSPRLPSGGNWSVRGTLSLASTST